MIRPSLVEGIGVFAIRHISKCCRSMFSGNDVHQEKYVEISRQEIDELPQHSKILAETYCLFDSEKYYVPENGFKKIDLVNFINHSDTPNLISINDGEYFEAIRDINNGEKLFVDYGELVDDD